MKMKKFDTAIKDFKNVIRINNDDFDSYRHIIYIYSITKYWYLTTLIGLLLFIYLAKDFLKLYIFKIYLSYR